jgi:hypothetical protein
MMNVNQKMLGARPRAIQHYGTNVKHAETASCSNWLADGAMCGVEDRHYPK